MSFDALKQVCAVHTQNDLGHKRPTNRTLFSSITAFTSSSTAKASSVRSIKRKLNSVIKIIVAATIVLSLLQFMMTVKVLHDMEFRTLISK